MNVQERCRRRPRHPTRRTGGEFRSEAVQRLTARCHRKACTLSLSSEKSKRFRGAPASTAFLFPLVATVRFSGPFAFGPGDRSRWAVPNREWGVNVRKTERSGGPQCHREKRAGARRVERDLDRLAAALS